MNRTQLIIIISIVTIIAAGVFYSIVWDKIEASPVVDKPNRKVRDGEVKQYTSDGRLKTVVNYDNGVKNGLSYLFHDDGKTILLAIPYKQGKREGTSKKYYESGKIYAETNYKNDALHGTRKVYYSSGKLKSQVDYFKGFPGIGTIEYLTNGRPKKSPSILHKQRGNHLGIHLEGNCEDIDFFIGKLIEDKYFFYLDENITRLESDKGRLSLDLNVYTPSYLKHQDIICSCESSQGNPVILKKRIQL